MQKLGKKFPDHVQKICMNFAGRIFWAQKPSDKPG